MIKLVGIKRLIVFTVLLAVNVALFGVEAYVFQPAVSADKKQIRQIQSKIRNVKSDLNSVLNSLSHHDEQEAQYNSLTGRGFFDSALKTQQAGFFVEAQERADVVTELTLFGSSNVVNALLDKAGYELVSQRISVEISALDDADIYHYIDIITKELPGYVRVRSLDVSRELPYDGELLRKILQGDRPSVVKGVFAFDWYFASEILEPAGEGR